MRRVVSLFLPRWPADRWRRKNCALPPDRPLVMAARQGQQRILTSVDEAAAQAGLTPDMTVTHAQSLVAGVTVIDAAPEQDAKALTKLALWCTRYAPLVTPDPPDGVFFDIAGSAHLFGGEERLLSDLVARLNASGMSARAAVADTPGCAWAVARFTKERVVAHGRVEEAMAELPIASLRLSAETVDSLRDVGIVKVAELISKPRATIPLRFGPDVLLRLDQALGRADEPLKSLLPPEMPRCELRFAEPIGDPEDLARVITRLVETLCRQLETKGAGARHLDLIFTRVDNVVQAVRIGLYRPNRDPAHLAKLLSERLELIDPSFGIEIAALSAPWIEKLSNHQIVGRHIEAGMGEDDLAPLLDMLGVQFGAKHVHRCAPVESDLPERAVKKIRAMDEDQGTDWPKRLPRPPRLLRSPEPVSVIAELPDHPPRLFVWRKRQHRIKRADGPERIYGEWWRSETETDLVRDYYRVETIDGARYWLFRDGPAGQGGSWLLHGIGDA
jgi:protein ImuB